MLNFCTPLKLSWEIGNSPALTYEAKPRQQTSAAFLSKSMSKSWEREGCPRRPLPNGGQWLTCQTDRSRNALVKHETNNQTTNKLHNMQTVGAIALYCAPTPAVLSFST